MEAIRSDPAEFWRRLETDFTRWDEAVRRSGAGLD
jgi:hypothetical protein